MLLDIMINSAHKNSYFLLYNLLQGGFKSTKSAENVLEK